MQWLQVNSLGQRPIVGKSLVDSTFDSTGVFYRSCAKCAGAASTAPMPARSVHHVNAGLQRTPGLGTKAARPYRVPTWEEGTLMSSGKKVHRATWRAQQATRSTQPRAVPLQRHTGPSSTSGCKRLAHGPDSFRRMRICSSTRFRTTHHRMHAMCDTTSNAHHATYSVKPC